MSASHFSVGRNPHCGAGQPSSKSSGPTDRAASKAARSRRPRPRASLTSLFCQRARTLSLRSTAANPNYTGSTSPPTTVNVQADFAFTASAPTITIASPGGSGTGVRSPSPVSLDTAGPSTSTAASCSGLPRESTCSFNPASVTNSGTTTLNVSTTAPHSARLEGPAWWTTSLGATLAGIFLLGSGSRRRAWSWLLSLMAVTCLITIVSCGGGSGSGSSGGNKDPGTPAGSSTVTVTATSGVITHTATITLTIQ